MNETIKLTEAQERGLRKAADYPRVFGGGWNLNHMPLGTLRALIRRDLIKWSHANTISDSGYVLTDAGRQLLQELDGMGGGSLDDQASKAAHDEFEHSIDALVLELASCRNDTEMAKVRLEAELAKHPEIAKWQAAVKEANEWEQRAYDALTAAAVEVFTETGDKQPHPHVTIKMMTTIDYDPVKALHWAQDNARYLLVLDTKQFDRTMRGVVNVPDFVTRAEQPKAFIDKDLS